MEALVGNFSANLPENCSLEPSMKLLRRARAAAEAGPEAAAEADLAAVAFPASEAAQTLMRVEELDWREDVAFLQPPFDVLLAADVVYDPKYVTQLVECMLSLSNPETLVLFAFYKRAEDSSAAFWKLLPQFFDIQKIPDEAFGMQNCSNESNGMFVLKKLSVRVPPVGGEEENEEVLGDDICQQAAELSLNECIVPVVLE